MKSITEKLPTNYSTNYDSSIETAFACGLLWGKCPEWFLDSLEYCYSWSNATGTDPAPKLRIEIIADTATSWHEAYRELRSMGWTRYAAKREGGLITYGLEHFDSFRPEGWQSIRVQFQVSLQTCRTVKVGTKEVDVFETVCDDIQEPEEKAYEEVLVEPLLVPTETEKEYLKTFTHETFSFDQESGCEKEIL